MRLMAILAVAAAFSASAANAASVEIRDAVARVTIVPQDRSDIRVEIVRPHPELPLSVSVSGDRTLIDGGLGRRIHDCNGMGGNARVSVRGVGKVPYDEMPQVVIYTPRDVEVEANGALVGAIGRSASLELDNSGCANWTIADVSGEAELRQSGAGNVKMGMAGRLDLDLSGAGNLNAVGVRDGMDARLSGAGGVTVGSFAGPMEAQVSGVGQIRVNEGRASRIKATVSGIGGIDFGGVAQDLQASISGLGNIRVKEVTGSVTKSVSGGGRIRVGNRPS
jgi:hypothetical protein